jgi:hypothetical protein
MDARIRHGFGDAWRLILAGELARVSKSPLAFRPQAPQGTAGRESKEEGESEPMDPAMNRLAQNR